MVLTTGDGETAPVRENATGLSRRADVNDRHLPASRQRTGRNGRFLQLARASLGLSTFAMLVASCLITDVPTFEDEVQTAPKLLKWTAFPFPQELLVIQSNQVTQAFSARVESAHDLEQPIGVRLYVDYGVPRSEGSPNPFRAYASFAPVPPSEDDPTAERIASASWTQDGTPPGCHSFTLMVAHRFDDATNCPEELSDSDEITWIAFICAPGQTCDTTDFDPNECPKTVRKCPEVADEARAGATSSTGGP
jgi:hypothetical protein